jgi:putative FmdB family regulatory protein
MPLYEYRCDACGHRLEVIRKFSDAPLTECPKCHAQALVKQFSSPAIQFKGSGFYITDYARKDSGKSSGESSTSSGDSGAKSESDSSSKSSTESSSASTSSTGSTSTTSSGKEK